MMYFLCWCLLSLIACGLWFILKKGGQIQRDDDDEAGQ